MSKLLESRDNLYNILLFEGQYYLGERAQTTLHFMTQVLQREKFLLKKTQIIPYDIDSKYEKILTLSRLVEIAQKDTVMQKFLPKDAEQHVSKVWLVNVMNSLDPGFFDRVTAEIEE